MFEKGLSNNCLDKPLGIFFGQRIVFFDDVAARKLYSSGFYGKTVGASKVRVENVRAPLELSLIEALYLLEEDSICIINSSGEQVDAKFLWEYIVDNHPSLIPLYYVYRDLRRRGYIVRSGLKYGAEFVIYERGPGVDHAPYVVHVISFNEYIDPLEIVRAGRLSHSVRKRFVIAAVNEKSRRIDYIVFRWIKP